MDIQTRILLDPTHEASSAKRERLARPDSIKGHKVGLLDISKWGGSYFLDILEKNLRAAGAEVIRYSKPTFTRVAPIDLRQLIASQCTLVIEALAD
jgi:hypothetical protein